MSRFHVLDDATVILRNKRGVYKQAKLYARDDAIYAGIGGGFVKLFRDGTSCPDISWSDLDAGGRVHHGGLGNPKLIGHTTPVLSIAGGVDHEAHA